VRLIVSSYQSRVSPRTRWAPARRTTYADDL
jgi:hypothetical protein